MIHKAKALGLAVIAVLAMSAVVAQAAQAEGAFTSEIETTTVKGSQVGEQKFVTSGGTVKCTTATFHGTITGTKVGENNYSTTTATLKPTYSGCTAFGFVGATIDTSGTGHECNYLFHMTASLTATADVECNKAGENIAITAGTCTTTVPAQAGLKHIVFTNTGTGTARDIDANVTIEGIEYTEGSGCFAPGTRANGTETGSATLQGFVSNTNTQVGIWAD